MSRKIVALFFLVFLIIPLMCFSQPAKQVISKVSFDFIDADIRNVIRILSEVSGKNIVISDAVKGKVTMKLDNVYWDEALEMIAGTSGIKVIPSDNIIRIVTQKEFEDEAKRKETERDAFRKENIEKQKAGEEFVTQTIYLNYANPVDVEKVIRGIAPAGLTVAAGAGGSTRNGFLSEYGTITEVPWDRALIVKDTRDNVATIIQIVKEHDVKPTQVQIDCKIVQASSTFSKEIGIQWGENYSSRSLTKSPLLVGGGQTWTSVTAGGTGTLASPVGELGFRSGGQIIPYNVNLPAAVGPGSGGIIGMYLGGPNSAFALDVQLSALEAQGKGRILSNPKVITSNNVKAVIQQGKSIPYQTVSTSGTQTQFAEAVLGLEVTPSVTNDGYIKLEVLAKEDQADFVNLSQGVPTIDKKQATTVLYVKDGETAVIGGIYERQENSSANGLPGLKDIPLLGWLFRHKADSDDKTELLIFITPRIVKDVYKDEG